MQSPNAAASSLVRLMDAINAAQLRQVAVIDVAASSNSEPEDSEMSSAPSSSARSSQQQQQQDVVMKSPMRTPKDLTEDVARMSPQQAASALLQAGAAVKQFRDSVANAPYVYSAGGVQQGNRGIVRLPQLTEGQRQAAAVDNALTAVCIGILNEGVSTAPPPSMIIIDPESPGVKILPKRQRDALTAAYHNAEQNVANRYATVLAERVSLIDTAVRFGRFGDPLDPTQYPRKSYKGRRDPFLDFAYTTEPQGDREMVVFTREAFANNVPYGLLSVEVLVLRDYYGRGVENHNIGELVRGLLKLGLEEDLLPEEDKIVLEEPERVSRFIDYRGAATRFLQSDFNLLRFTAFVGVFPFQNPLYEAKHMQRLREGAIQALATHFADQANDFAFVEMYRSTLVKSFFRMKQFQSIEQLKRDAFTFDENCPLFSKYSHIKTISAGSYGFVLRVMPRETHKPAAGGMGEAEVAELSRVDGADESEELLLSSGPLFAVKIQRVGEGNLSHRSASSRDPGIDLDIDDTAFTELMVSQTIMNKTKHWRAEHRASNMCNHVRMFDFVRCAFNPRQVFAPLLREDDVTRISRKLLPDSYDEWQIMVLEYADSGSLDAMLSSGNPKNVALLSTLDGFASITIQILGHIQALRDAKYTHHDMKPLNILLSAVHPRRSGRYFAYKDVAIGMNGESQTLYVPVWGLGYVAKLADNGFASITGTATLPDGKTITQYIPSKRARMGKSGHTYNPAIDLELYGYTYLRGIFKGHQMLGHTLKQACKKIAPGIFNWVLTYCRNNPAGTVKGSKEAKTYDDIQAFLSDAYSWRMDDTNRWPFPEDKWSYRVVYSLMDTVYSEYSVNWHGVKPPGSENCIAVALGSSTFWPFTRAPPEKYTEDNKGILVMTDYRS